MDFHKTSINMPIELWTELQEESIRKTCDISELIIRKLKHYRTIVSKIKELEGRIEVLEVLVNDKEKIKC